MLQPWKGLKAAAFWYAKRCPLNTITLHAITAYKNAKITLPNLPLIEMCFESSSACNTFEVVRILCRQATYCLCNNVVRFPMKKISRFCNLTSDFDFYQVKIDLLRQFSHIHNSGHVVMQ